jgi:hypothetical protein
MAARTPSLTTLGDHRLVARRKPQERRVDQRRRGTRRSTSRSTCRTFVARALRRRNFLPRVRDRSARCSKDAHGLGTNWVPETALRSALEIPNGRVCRRWRYVELPRGSVPHDTRSFHGALIQHFAIERSSRDRIAELEPLGRSQNLLQRTSHAAECATIVSRGDSVGALSTACHPSSCISSEQLRWTLTGACPSIDMIQWDRPRSRRLHHQQNRYRGRSNLRMSKHPESGADSVGNPQ